MIEVLLQHKSSIRKLRALSLSIALLLAPFSAWGQKSITVAGTTVDETGGSFRAITGDGISGLVVIDFEINRLELTNATINGDIRFSDSFLQIYLTGKNTVNGNIISTIGVEYEGQEDDLCLTRGYYDSATLKYTGNIEGFNVIDGGVNYNEADAFKPVFSNTVGTNTYHYYTSLDVYNLEVEGLTVHNIEGEPGYKGNILQDEGTPTVTFDGTNKVTLNGATLTNYINWKTDADLTIELKGANSINSTDISCFVNNHNKNISFIQGDASNPCSLTLNCGTGGVIGNGFYNYTTPIMGAGLYWFPTTENGYITSATVKTLLGGGEGTVESPYRINTYDDLKAFATYVNDGTLTTEYVRLDADIDCDGKTDFTPIGSKQHFKGHFDGNGKTISNLLLSTDIGRNGLFLYVDGGTIQNLTLSNCSFSGGSFVGAIAAELYNDAKIENCKVNSCTIQGGNMANIYVGGIVGRMNQGTITGCEVNGGTIKSSAESTSTSYAIVGGIAGDFYKGTISSCVVAGADISLAQPSQSWIGGIVGYATNDANNVISNNQVKGNTKVSYIHNGTDNVDMYVGATAGYTYNLTISRITRMNQPLRLRQRMAMLTQ